MSRSTVAKSRAEKAGKTGQGTAPTPAITHEIVPGKFTDQDWNLMLEHDDSDDFLQGIVEEICSSALERIYQNYLQRQLIPFTVLQAKEAMLQIIEWQFLAHDEGEIYVDDNPNWMEDDEPDIAVTDCWAQGSVPKNSVLPAQRTPVMDTLMEEIEADEETSNERIVLKTDDQDRSEINKSLVDTKEEESSIVIEESTIVEETVEKTELQDNSRKDIKKKKKAFKPHYGPLHKAKVDQMTESLEQREIEMLYADMPTPPPPKTPETAILQMPNSCHSIIKLQAGRPPGNRDVVYDHAGNVVSITKLNPERLPNHRIRTGFQVVDPQVEAAQVRLEAMRTGRHFRAKKPAPPASQPDSKLNETNTSYGRRQFKLVAMKSSKEEMQQLPPPLIDSMELSPGVVVREGDRLKRGPKQQPSKSDFSTMTKRKLRPVVVNGGTHAFSVQDLLGNQQPIIRSLDSPPVPPIIPHPPAQKAL